MGRRTKTQVAGQEPVTYQYDANSRLTEINTMINSVAAGFNLNYDDLGRRTSLTLPNGVTTNYSYDNASRLLNLEHLNPAQAILESLSYVYDPNGNRTSMNRQAVNLPLPTSASNISYNPANQMLTFTPSTGSAKNMTYDDNGNMTSVTNSCGTTTYDWDARNRLVGIDGYKPDCTLLNASFKYDALGRRIEKTINGKTIQYLYDGLDIVQEIENGVISVNYVRTLNIDEPLARIKADGTVRYYQTDALGSVIALTDEAGAIKTQYMYDPYGNVIVSGEPSDNPFQYTGRENDGIGLYYYRFRYYSPELQRFISEDPIGLIGGDVNYYAHVGNNPLNLVDPLGLIWGGGGIEGGVFLPFGGFEGSVDIVHDDSGNVAIVLTICSGVGKTQGLSRLMRLIGFSFGFGPIIGQGTLKEGCSQSYGVSSGIGLGGYGGIDIVTDQDTGEYAGDFRVGFGAGFYLSAIGCKTKIIPLGNYLK